MIRFKKGQTVTHMEFGRCIITETYRTRVEIEVIERGPGWDEITETYRPYREVRLHPDAGPGARSIHWRTTHRDQYGHRETINVNELI